MQKQLNRKTFLAIAWYTVLLLHCIQYKRGTEDSASAAESISAGHIEI